MEQEIDPVELAMLPIFRGLDIVVIQTIAKSARIKKAYAGEFIFLQGDKTERFFILLSGRIKLTQASQDGQQVLLRIIGAETMFGGMIFSEEAVYPVNAEAAEDCEVVFWGKTDMMAAMKSYPQILMNMLRLMSKQMQELETRFTQLVTERVERRIARTLLRLGSQFGKKTAEGVLIDMPISRQDLAEMCGTTLYTASRTLSHWEEQGLIKSGRERVVIRHPHDLVIIAEDLPLPGNIENNID
jgi:CRP-like cAMP-binding protein